MQIDGETHANYKVLWLQTGVLATALRDSLSQISFPAVNRLLKERERNKRLYLSSDMELDL